VKRPGTGGTSLYPARIGPLQLGWFVYVLDGRPPWRWFPSLARAERHQHRVGYETNAEWQERLLREGAERRARGEDQTYHIDGVPMDDWVRLPTTDDRIEVDAGMAAPISPLYEWLPNVLCGNEKHPLGAGHPAAPYVGSWQLRGRLRQWWNLRRWGCRCDRLPPSQRPVEDSLPTVHAPRGGIKFQ
jgi:hypothetical protein